MRSLGFALSMLIAAPARETAELQQGCMAMPSFLQWSAGRVFPYHAPAERQRTIRAGYSRLRVGMTDSEAKATLGKPDWSGPSPTGCVWEYDLARPGPTGYEKGVFRILFIEFGTDKKLRNAKPKNIPGLHTIGSSRR